MIKILIHWTRKDHSPEFDQSFHILIVGLEHYFDIWVVENFLEHMRKTASWHVLILVAEIAVIRIGSCRNARRYGFVQLRRIHTPLLSCVSQEEFLIQVPSD